MVVVVSAVVTPVTTPAGDTVAIADDRLLQLPPDAVASVSVMDAPWHTLSNPVIVPGLGNALTVTA